MTDLLTSFINVAPFVNSLTTGDCAVAVSDTEKMLIYVPGKSIDHKIQPGDPIKPGSAVRVAIESGKRVVIRVGKELFGFPYVGVGMPIRDSKKKIIGAISLNENVAAQDTFIQMADRLFAMISEVTLSAESLAAEAGDLAKVGRQLYQLGNGLGERVQETSAVLKVMHQVTSQTNLLGLNASIEAARVGEKGLGFGVVADEIRKLSESSVRSLKEIGDILKTLNTANNALFHEIEQVTRISGEQAKAVQNVTAAINEVNVLAQSLLQFTDQLIIK
jgi:hypothetical protein